PSGDAAALRVAIDPAGEIYVGGTQNFSPNGPSRLLTARFSPAGALRWFASHVGDSLLGANPIGIKLDPAGVWYRGGSAHMPGRDGRDFVLLRYAADGHPVWRGLYDNGFGENANRLILDPQRRPYLAGRSGGGESGDDLAIVRYTPGPPPCPGPRD